MLPVALLAVIFTSVIGAAPSVFMQKIIAIIENYWRKGNWQLAEPIIRKNIIILIALYVVAIISSIVFSQILAIMTQGILKKLRNKMFNGMQDLPLKFFDSNYHGDIMSYYTNDIDTLRQLISIVFPQLLISGITVATVFCIMLYYSIWMTAIIVVGFTIIFKIVKKTGGRSARYFFQQQKQLGKVEGFIEEMINGQRVIKVFTHEEEAKKDFAKLNQDLFEKTEAANKFANIIGPIVNNLGNVFYVIVALVGGLFLILRVPNFSFSGLPLGVSITVPFLNMTKQFVGNIGRVSMQVNSIAAGLAGTRRIFELMDQKAEVDQGQVRLVKVIKTRGILEESKEKTGLWAWKKPKGDGFELIKLQGDVRFENVYFQYEEGKSVLENINLYAKPGQKIAFVGATGAGKTTITNLINRFYDIQKGKITYDGIDIKTIKKADLRRSLGIVLQDTRLFTGTVADNIRYGRLDATDEEVEKAAKLAGADDFIRRLPDGYKTMLAGDGSNLSQGQRQLLSIARAAVADPPVMILDEATSSIDTRTETIVQRGMDALMEGRTVFVIAHRLSTVKNSNVIIVLDQGCIIERGAHQDLLKQKGHYYQLYTGAFELE